jgi:hypothetical protein
MQARTNPIERPRAEVLGRKLCARGHVDADRENPCSQQSLATAHLAVVEHLGAYLGLRYGAQERIEIAFRLKSNEVIGTPLAKQLPVHRQRPEHLERGQRSVQEEAERLLLIGTAQERSERNQVKIVHPNHVVGT